MRYSCSKQVIRKNQNIRVRFGDRLLVDRSRVHLFFCIATTLQMMVMMMMMMVMVVVVMVQVE